MKNGVVNFLVFNALTVTLSSKLLTMAPITVGIAGFTGRVAGLLTLSLLEQDPNVQIKGLARTPANVSKSISSKNNVQVIQGGAFDTDKIRSFVHGCDVVVCCYSHDDRIMVDGQKLLIDLAEEEGVPRYVASDWCLDYTKLGMGELFAKEASQRIKGYLDTKNSIKGVHMLIGGFTEVIFAAFFRIWDSQTSTLRYWGTGDEVWECTTYQNSAQYTAAVCLDRAAFGVFRCKAMLSFHDLAFSAYLCFNSCWRCHQYQRYCGRVGESVRCQTKA